MDTLHQVLIYLGDVAGLLALGYLLVGVRSKAARFPGSLPVAQSLSGLIQMVCQVSCAAVASDLQKMDPAAQEPKIREIAAQVYAALPETLVLPIEGIDVTVPLKMLVSQELFTQGCLLAYKGVEDVYRVLLSNLLKDITAWNQQGRKVPPSAKVFSLREGVLRT